MLMYLMCDYRYHLLCRENHTHASAPILSDPKVTRLCNIWPVVMYGGLGMRFYMFGKALYKVTPKLQFRFSKIVFSQWLSLVKGKRTKDLRMIYITKNCFQTVYIFMGGNGVLSK